jgi:hypothetical protein
MQPRRHFLRTSFTGAAAAVVSLAGSPLAWGQSSGSHTPSRLPTESDIRARGVDVWLLVDLINDYRRRNGLHAVPLSPRLTAVAALHVKDLEKHRPHEVYGSLHSWSETGRWTGGAYRESDDKTWPLMWQKPKEIAGYDGFGFEISAARVRDLRHALAVWQVSPSHNNLLLNRERWKDPRWQWQAVGAVFHKGYACAWFGDQPDLG